MALTFNPPSGTITETEPLSGNLSMTVGIVQPEPPAAGGEGGGTGETYTYKVKSVVCNNKSSMINSGSALQLTWTDTSFTFSDRFRDLIPRTFKFTRNYPVETVTWNSVDLDGATAIGNGTNVVRIKTATSQKFRVGDTVVIEVDDVEPSERTKLNGTWKITAITGAKNVTDTDRFYEFTIKINDNFAAGTHTFRAKSYNVYNVVTRIRDVQQIDNNVIVGSYTGIYEFIPPTAGVTLSFTVTYETISSLTQQVVSTETDTWSMTMNPNFEVSLQVLQEAVAAGREAIKSKANENPVVP